eukprot:c50473_g1_i1 orf=50-298(+)
MAEFAGDILCLPHAKPYPNDGSASCAREASLSELSKLPQAIRTKSKNKYIYIIFCAVAAPPSHRDALPLALLDRALPPLAWQ